jgi:hypothetical protein
MRARSAARWSAGLAVGLLAAFTATTSTSAAPGQELPPVTVVPPLPDEVDPVAAAVSPVLWQACNGVGFGVGLIVLAGTLAGVPSDVGVPLNDAIATASGPVLLTFFEVCQQIPLPDEPPSCETDQLVPLLPSLGRPFLPAALLANELRALDTALDGAGLPLDGALADAADDLLACAAGRDPEPDPPRPGPEPDAPDTITEPTVASSGPSGGGTARPSTSSASGAPSAPRAPEEAPVGGGSLPVSQPVSSSGGGTGTGLALSLLGLAGLAVLGWLHAGNPRAGRATAAAVVTR